MSAVVVSSLTPSTFRILQRITQMLHLRCQSMVERHFHQPDDLEKNVPQRDGHGKIVGPHLSKRLADSRESRAVS
jgi:hypothetical protein